MAGDGFALGRRAALKGAAAGMALVPVAGVLLPASRAAAASPLADDIAQLQTCASLELTAIATYDTLLDGEAFDGAPYYRSLLTDFKGHHEEHLAAISAALARLGGAEQRQPNKRLSGDVGQTHPEEIEELELGNELLGFVIEAELAHHHTASAAALHDPEARRQLAEIAGVEAQHFGLLNMFETLIEDHLEALIASPTQLRKVPKAAALVGAPDSFQKTFRAQAPGAGAVDG